MTRRPDKTWKTALKLTLPLAVLLTALLLPIAARPQPAAGGGTLFVTADRCMACHNGMVTPLGEDVSMGLDWRASMMANSARDPYWQAAVRREVLDHPTLQAAIENECSACHMPMARFEAHTAGANGQVFAHLPILGTQSPRARLAADGVSCAMCHQVQDERLGEAASFTAGFVVDTTKPAGQREIFGPFAVDPARQRIMRSAVRFQPTQATHIQRSEVCATCHTLYTHAFGPDGTVIGELPEQVPYLEWRHSAYRDEQSCQSCHMPVVEGKVPITGVWGDPREGVSRHVFRGGNFFIPRVLSLHAAELGVTALPRELDLTARRTRDHLATSAARLTIERAEITDGRLRVELSVANLAGHKLPTAYPSRRTWLYLSVRDAQGETLFESGALQSSGMIAGNDNDLDPGRYEPHHEVIDSADEVQVYEAILGGPDGAVTTGLLTAVTYLKDNRLLPRGFDKSTAGEDIAVHGLALDDGNFTGDGDRIRYLVAVGEGAGPLTVEAKLWYQPIAYRWAQNLLQQEAPETTRFVGYYDAMASSSAALLDRAQVALP